MVDSICYIVGAGENYGLDFTPKPGDLVIAADGGLTALQQIGLQPDILVGDFDSLGWTPQGDRVILLPKEKDVTDTWAALEEGIRLGFRQFVLYGCTGGRFEHTLANVQTLAQLAQQGLSCRLIDRTQIITAISGSTMTFDASHRGYLSVFSHSDRCTGVTLRGLKYELENAELTNRFPLGVSNEFTGQESAVTIGEGTAILVFDRH